LADYPSRYGILSRTLLTRNKINGKECSFS
jgi:hypothetical protein